MSTSLTVEEHLAWLRLSLRVAEGVVLLSASPGKIPQFEQAADFRTFLERRLCDAQWHAGAIEAALGSPVLNQTAPFVVTEGDTDR